MKIKTTEIRSILRVRYAVLLLSGLLGCTGFCGAQSRLSGTLSDPAGNPLPYASVVLSGAGDRGVLNTEADSAGHFRFEALSDGEYRLTVSRMGFAARTLSLRIHTDTLIRITVHPDTRQLSGVTVAANKPTIEQKADRVIYNVTQSISAAGSDALETLGKVPGIKVGTQDISLAGKGTVGVMINGRLLPLSGEELNNYLKSLSSGQVDRIELITHPSASYDAEGNAGLINIITRQNKTRGLSGDIQGSLLRFIFQKRAHYGVANYGYLNGSANLSYNTGPWNAYGSVNFTHGRELEGYGIDVHYPRQQWAMTDTGDYKHRAVNLIAGADYKLSPHASIGFQYSFGDEVYSGADYVNNPIYHTGGGTDSILRAYAIYYPVALSNALNLHWIDDFGGSGKKLSVDADYFNYYRTDYSDFESSSYTPDGSPNPGGTTRYHDSTKQNILVYTLKADFELPTAFAKFTMGGKISFINNYSNIYYYDKLKDSLRFNSELSNEYNYRENTQAAYISASKESGPWKMDAGVRAELTQTTGVSYFLDQTVRKDYLKIFPSLLLSYKPEERNAFSLAYNKRINRPTFWELNPYISLMTAYSYVEGNPFLEPEYNTNISLTHTYKSILTSSVYLTVTNNGFTNVTLANADSNYIHTKPLNFITTHRYGLSESVSLSPWAWLESTTGVNAYYTDAGSGLPYIRGVRGWGLYVSTSNTFSFNRKKTLMGTLDFWCQFPEVDHFGRSDTYYKLDLGLRALSLKKKLSIALNANDLLISGNSIVYTTVSNIRQAYTTFHVFSNIKLSLSYRFGNHDDKGNQRSNGNEEERERTQ